VQWKIVGRDGRKVKFVLVSITNDKLLIDKLLIHKLLIGEVMIDKGMTNNLLVDNRRSRHSLFYSRMMSAIDANR
jgi:hypothetical protein